MWIRIETVAEDYCLNLTELLDYASRIAVQEKHKIVSGEINDMYISQFIDDAVSHGIARSMTAYSKKFDKK